MQVSIYEYVHVCVSVVLNVTCLDKMIHERVAELKMASQTVDVVLFVVAAVTKTVKEC